MLYLGSSGTLDQAMSSRERAAAFPKHASHVGNILVHKHSLYGTDSLSLDL